MEIAFMEDTKYWCEEHDKEEFLIFDPYQAEIYNEEVEMWLCEDCEQRRRDDI